MAACLKVRSTLQNLQSFIGNCSIAAHQVGAFPLTSVATAAGVRSALDTTVKDALGASGGQFQKKAVKWRLVKVMD